MNDVFEGRKIFLILLKILMNYLQRILVLKQFHLDPLIFITTILMSMHIIRQTDKLNA